MIEDRSLFAALGPDAGHEERKARGRGPDARQLARRGRPDDQPDRAPGSPLHGPPRDTPVERFGRRTDGGIGRHVQVLQLPGTRVGRPAEDVGEPVGPLEQRLDRLGAEVRADGDRIRTQDLSLPAPRPTYSVLDCSKAEALGVRPRGWRDALRAFLRSPDSPLAPEGKIA